MGNVQQGRPSQDVSVVGTSKDEENCGEQTGCFFLMQFGFNGRPVSAVDPVYVDIPMAPFDDSDPATTRATLEDERKRAPSFASTMSSSVSMADTRTVGGTSLPSTVVDDAFLWQESTHLDECQQHLALTADGNNDASIAASARDFYEIGCHLYKSGLYKDSLRSLAQAVALYNYQRDGRRHKVHLAECHYTVGKVYLSLGSPQRSKKSYRKALAVLNVKKDSNGCFRRRDARTNQLLARIMLALGHEYETNGQYEIALEYFQDALWIQKDAEEPVHPNVASSLLSFGSILEKTGNYHLALDCFEEALEIYRRCDSATAKEKSAATSTSTSSSESSSSSSVDRAVALANVGWACYLLGRFDDSLDAYEESLQIQRAALGWNHRNIASVLAQKGTVFLETGRIHESLMLFRDAIRIQRQCFGDTHDDIAVTLSLSGAALERAGMLEKAKVFVEHARQIRTKALGEDHLLV